jgi:deoxyribonuclease-2
MGQCLSCYSYASCITCNDVTLQVVIKLPHGHKSILYHNGVFLPIESIQDWVQELYNSNWEGWAAYNDETSITTLKSKGHCKGIVSWNLNKIGWLIHSVPNFPTELTHTSISPILPSELMYGQSFVYIEMKYSNDRLENIFKQINWMDANIYLHNNLPLPNSYVSKLEIKKINISSTITHHSKPARYTVDIYGEYLCSLDSSKWYVETWRRGCPIHKVTTNLYDVNKLCWNSLQYKESQDHSKWAVSKKYVWIGDLNRMESQKKRGGGGVLIRDHNLVKAFRSLIVS